MSRTGRIWPVRFVMCVTSMTRVRGVMAWRKRVDDVGRRTAAAPGSEIGLTTMPSRRARCSQEVIMRG